MDNMVDPSLITAIILLIAPGIGILVSMSSLFNLGKKELEEYFNDVRQYVQKRKVENLLKLIFPERIGVIKDADGYEISKDVVQGLAMDIDRIEDLNKALKVCSWICTNYYNSLFILIVIGAIFVALHFMGLNDNAISNYYSLVDFIAILYILVGFAILGHKKHKLNTSYEKEYAI
jgi:hypothetical protein